MCSRQRDHPSPLPALCHEADRSRPKSRFDRMRQSLKEFSVLAAHDGDEVFVSRNEIAATVCRSGASHAPQAPDGLPPSMGGGSGLGLRTDAAHPPALTGATPLPGSGALFRRALRRPQRCRPVRRRPAGDRHHPPPCPPDFHGVHKEAAAVSHGGQVLQCSRGGRRIRNPCRPCHPFRPCRRPAFRHRRRRPSWRASQRSWPRW